MPLEEKLARYTVETEDCWLWAGAATGEGYPVITHGSKQIRAHRLAWELANGRPIPDGLSVLHTCDNPLCVRPAHLRVGTHADNMRDMGAKGRAAVVRCRRLRGEENGFAKLTEAAVREILAAKPYYGWRNDYARRFGVSVSAIKHVRARHNWLHVDPPPRSRLAACVRHAEQLALFLERGAP